MAQKLESAWDRRGFPIRRVSPAPHLDLRCRLSRELQAGSGRLFPAKHARTLGGRRLESAAEDFRDRSAGCPEHQPRLRLENVSRLGVGLTLGVKHAPLEEVGAVGYSTGGRETRRH